MLELVERAKSTDDILRLLEERRETENPHRLYPSVISFVKKLSQKMIDGGYKI